MKEVKFRAWILDDERMLPDGDIGYLDGYSLNGVFEDESYVFMQFIGLKDKNGKEIYEGDIVKIPNGLILEIKWEIGFHQYCGKSRATSAGFNFLYKHDEIEIVGNIYENPELLK